MRHPLAERGADLSETLDVAVHELLRAGSLPPRIWGPACGPGWIVTVLSTSGHEVVATDINDYGCPESQYGIDLLLQSENSGVAAIVTDPPFKLAAEFVHHALTFCPRVIMLLRLVFLESERRRRLLEDGQLARVHVFRNRLPMMHRAGWDGPVASSSTAFARFVFDREHQGPNNTSPDFMEGVTFHETTRCRRQKRSN
jgi:hypothetical protein